MEYAIPLALVLVVVTAVIVMLVQRTASKAGPRAEDRGSGPGIGADEESPLGDTSQHAGTQEDGESVAGYDAGRSGGAGRRRGSGYEGTSPVGHDEDDPAVAAHVQRPGEGEGRTQI
jgi:hypothetical protein